MTRSPSRLLTLTSLTCAATLAVTACRTFQPAEPTGLRPGQTVRVELADSASRAEAGWTGPDRDRLTGEVVTSSAGGMALSVRSRTGSGNLTPYRDTLRLPTSLIRSVQRQEISPLRSAAVAGGVVAATALLFELNAVGGTIRPPQDGGGGTESVGIRLPIIP